MIDWNVSPIAFRLASFEVRWYGVLFAVSFLLADWIFIVIARRDGLTSSDHRKILLLMMISTVIGGRLGHCLFYHWNQTLNNPASLLAVRDGGNASHGVVACAICVMACFALRQGWSVLWLFDRMCVAIPLVAACVRVGNFFNSEIVGIPTDGTWGVVFSRVDSIPRHPVVLYEAAAYILLLVVLITAHRHHFQNYFGALFGLFLVGLFSARFLLEYLKSSPWIHERIPLTMGQLLSIPCIVVGTGLSLAALSRNTHRRQLPS